MTLSFDPLRSKVILIGTTQCEDQTNLPNLPAVGNNIKDLAGLFYNPEIIGLPKNSVEVILDAPTGTSLLTRLASVAKLTTDTLLVYYSGHGIKSSSDSGLFIATSETTQELCDINGVEWRKIQRIIDQSPAEKKILIFDCCYSGEIFAGDMGGAAEAMIANAIDISGTYAIASSSRNSLSFSLPNDQYTGFTGRLIEVLKTGVKDKVETITLDRLYDELRRRIATFPKLPAPQRRNFGEINEFILAKNIAWASDPEVRLQRLEQKHKQLMNELEQKHKTLLNKLEEKHEDLLKQKQVEICELRQERDKFKLEHEDQYRKIAELQRMNEEFTKLFDDNTLQLSEINKRCLEQEDLIGRQASQIYQLTQNMETQKEHERASKWLERSDTIASLSTEDGLKSSDTNTEYLIDPGASDDIKLSGGENLTDAGVKPTSRAGGAVVIAVIMIAFVVFWAMFANGLK
jgi:hypothetical protein